MTARKERFHLSPETRILTPEVAGLAELLHALREGLSILAQPGATPIQAQAEQTQWLYCKSSGSTGYAKTIRRSPESWIRSFEMDQELFALGARDTYASLGNLSHSLTLFAAVAACHIGADLAMLGDCGPREQLGRLGELRASVLYATPAQLRLLRRAAGKRQLEGLRLLFSSGGKLDHETRAGLKQLFPSAQVIEIFGATETSYMTIAGPDAPEGSVGQAYPGVEIRIDSPDADGVGEIWIRSPFVFDGYAKGESQETRWNKGWLTIGEMGQLDESGNLFAKGRKNRMVTVADKNVFPEEIEAVLMRVPEVEIAVVCAVPDVLRGHVIHAAVQGEASPAVLRQLCRHQIGDHAVPRSIRKVAKIPMLAAGKPDLQALRDLWDDL